MWSWNYYKVYVYQMIVLSYHYIIAACFMFFNLKIKYIFYISPKVANSMCSNLHKNEILNNIQYFTIS